MRAYEIQLDEAPMNPGEYNKAIDTGHSKGVLVGFEFECVVPEETIKGRVETPGAAPGGKTKEEIRAIISDGSVIVTSTSIEEFPPAKFDSLFKILPGKSKYPDMVSIVAAYDANSMSKIKELFDKIPEQVRAKLVPVAKKEAVSRDSYKPTDNPQLNFAYQLGQSISYAPGTVSGITARVKEIGWKMCRLTRQPDYEDLFEFGFGNDGYYIENHFTDYFDFDPQTVYDKLNLSDYDDDDDDNDNDNDGSDAADDYSGAVKILQPALEQAMGAKVNVFRRYHERKKNMTDWYIEPDGSLEGNNDGDGTAEVVSPPLPAKDAITALKNFFALASQYKIYTNESTGLHINVSIPEKIDLLKLAVFTGDQYVLKNFNRLDNDYAQSVTKDLGTEISDRGVATVKQGLVRDKDVFGKRKQTTTINTKLLKQIAGNISNNHTASISSNGRWISFRHAGGNYLKDYTEIYNVVGRFVRAVIIASDPTLYVREYKTAIAKIAVPAAKISDTLASKLNYITTKGIPVMEISIADTGRSVNVNPNALLKKVCDNNIVLPSYAQVNPNQISMTPNSADARAKMKSVASPNGQFIKWEQTSQDTRYVTAIYYPMDTDGMEEIENSDDYSSLSRDGTTYWIIRKSVIPGTDPRAKQIMLNIRKEHYRSRQPQSMPAHSRNGVRRAGFRQRRRSLVVW